MKFTTVGRASSRATSSATGSSAASPHPVSLIYNEFLTLEAMLPETFEYRVHSALEGVMDRYKMATDNRTATVPPFQGG